MYVCMYVCMYVYMYESTYLLSIYLSQCMYMCVCAIPKYQTGFNKLAKGEHSSLFCQKSMDEEEKKFCKILNPQDPILTEQCIFRAP